MLWNIIIKLNVNVSQSRQHYSILLESLQCLCILNTPPNFQFWTIQLISTYSMWLWVSVVVCVCFQQQCVITHACGMVGIPLSECEVNRFCLFIVFVCLRWSSQFSCALIRPVVVLQLGVVLWVGVFHCDASRQDGGHVVSNWLPLSLLLLLLLHLLQLDACRKIWSVKPCFKTYIFIKTCFPFLVV